MKRVLGWALVIGFLAVTTAGLWLPPIISRATVKDYHFPEVTIDATVRPDGDLVLRERRTFDFRNGPFTYAFFQVADPLDLVDDFEMAEILDDGTAVPVAPDFAEHSVASNGFQAQWSYVAEDETRTWEFRYRVECAVDVYADTAHLYWQFIGTGWDQPTDHAVITVHVPTNVETSDPRPATCDPTAAEPGEEMMAGAFTGEIRAFGHGPLNGTVTRVEPRTIRYEVRDVPPLSFVEGSILFPANTVPLAPQTGQERLETILAQERAWAQEANELRRRHDAERRWVLWLLVGVPAACAFLVLLAKLRDRVRDVPPILEQPPEGDPVAAALLWSAWRGHLSPKNAYRAQILRLVRLGAVELRADGLVTDPKDLTLVRRMDALDLATIPDQDFMWLLFGRGDDAVEEVSIRKPKPRRRGGGAASRYTKWLQASKDKSKDLLRRIQDGDARLESIGAAVVTIGAAGYGLWTTLWGLGGPIGWWLIPVSAVSLIVALTIIPARLGLEDRTRVMRLAAFRRYLKDFSDLPNAPTLAVIIWEHHLEWAVALNVADEVEKQVKALVPVESLCSPIPGGPTGLAGLHVWQSFQAAAPTLVLHSMASASRGSTSGGFGSSSSSSGFSSGGFSGGGGGGGGGTGGGAG